ncbi:MAG: hypothetical protein JWL67_2612 [Solirubrobacterales bacterium]|nr:hypothetical protein [Solirubrobacterales bacterium]
MSADDAFELPGGGRAVFTARAHGNLSSVAGEQADRGEASRAQLRKRLGLDRLARGYQVHGSFVRRVSSGEPDERPGPPPGASAARGGEAGERREEADGQATALRRVGTLVVTADCMPVALGCRGAVAIVHAGWRGLAAGVLEEGVRALEELAGQQEVVAIIGPCAGPCCYEVGEEVHAAFDGVHRDGRHLDIRAIAHDRLLAAGVAAVRDVPACTICDERYFSHRREGSRAGRQAGVAWLS